MPGFVQTANSGTPSGAQSSRQATFANAAQTAGNLNAVIISYGASAANAANVINSVLDVSNNIYVPVTTWTIQKAGSGGTPDTLGMIIYACPNIKAAASGANIVTVGLSTPMVNFTIAVVEEAIAVLSSPLDGTPASAKGDFPAALVANSGSLITANANDVLLGAMICSGAPAASPNLTPGFTQRAKYYTLVFGDQVVSATGTYSFSATSNDNTGWVAQLVAFKASVPAVTAPPTVTLPPSYTNSPPFIPVTFPSGPPTAQKGVYEDGPGQFLNPSNTGTPVAYAGTAQTSVIVNVNPKPPRQTHPGAAGSDSKIK